MIEEIWKDVNGYELHYQVSNLGRVRSKDRVVVFSDGRKRNYKSSIKSLIFNKYRGYYYVNLKVDGVNKFYAVHRLVAENFIKRHDVNLVVDHIDNNRKNNKVSNLQWVTQRDNLNKTRKNPGVCWHKRMNKWMAYIYINNKIKHLGYFINKSEAIEAYKKALYA